MNGQLGWRLMNSASMWFVSRQKLSFEILSSALLLNLAVILILPRRLIRLPISDMVGLGRISYW